MSCELVLSRCSLGPCHSTPASLPVVKSQPEASSQTPVCPSIPPPLAGLKEATGGKAMEGATRACGEEGRGGTHFLPLNIQFPSGFLLEYLNTLHGIPR